MPKKAKQPKVTDMQVYRFLKDHDFDLWASRRKLRDVKQSIESEFSAKVTFKQLRKCAAEVCEYFLVERRVSPSRVDTLDETQWHQISVALRRNWGFLCSKSDNAIVSFLRLKGCVVNERILGGSATLSQLRNCNK